MLTGFSVWPVRTVGSDSQLPRTEPGQIFGTEIEYKTNRNRNWNPQTPF
jgi:hypothetical protein